MANVPVMCICREAAREDLNAVCSAMIGGSIIFERKLCDINEQNATHETPPTHRVLQMAVPQQMIDVLAAMALDNDLPPLPPGAVWGENGVISAQDAQAAIADENLLVFPAYGILTQQAEENWQAGVLQGMDLKFVPDEEF